MAVLLLQYQPQQYWPATAEENLPISLLQIFIISQEMEFIRKKKSPKSNFDALLLAVILIQHLSM